MATDQTPSPARSAPPKRRRRRASLRLTERGATKRLECAEEFRRLLQSAAELSTRRRRSRVVEDTDFARAFDHLVIPPTRARTREAVATLSTFVAGSFLGYGITLLHQPNGTAGPGWALVIVSILAAVLAQFFRHLTPPQ